MQRTTEVIISSLPEGSGSARAGPGATTLKRCKTSSTGHLNHSRDAKYSYILAACENANEIAILLIMDQICVHRGLHSS